MTEPTSSSGRSAVARPLDDWLDDCDRDLDAMTAQLECLAQTGRAPSLTYGQLRARIDAVRVWIAAWRSQRSRDRPAPGSVGGGRTPTPWCPSPPELDD